MRGLVRAARMSVVLKRALVALLAVALIASCILYYNYVHLGGCGYGSKATLLLGIDESGKRADAIYVLYRSRFGVSALCLPRDLMMLGGHKLNGLYGRLGITGFKQIIEKMTGQPINNCLIVRMSVARAIDHVFPAGTRVVLQNSFHYRDRAAHLAYDLRAGAQTLSGKQVIFVLRDRKSGGNRGDSVRVERFRLIGAAFVSQIKRDPLALTRVPDAIKQARADGSLETDLNASDVVSLLCCARKGLVSHRIATTPYKARNGAWFEKANPEDIRRQANLARGGALPPESLRTFVLNGTETGGIARRFAARIESRYGIGAEIGNAAHYTSHTVVSYSPRSNARVRRLASVIAQDMRVPVHSSGVESSMPVITIQIGTDRATGGI